MKRRSRGAIASRNRHRRHLHRPRRARWRRSCACTKCSRRRTTPPKRSSRLAARCSGIDATAEIVTYSSTVATNALLEKKGARVALFTNAGFEDLIEIGRQNRNDLYALAPSRPDAAGRARDALRRRRAHAVRRRIIKSLSRAELARIRRLAERSGAEAFAVCLLHSYANPAGRGGNRARACAPRAAAFGLASDSRRVPRIRALLDRRRQRLRRTAHASHLKTSNPA